MFLMLSVTACSPVVQPFSPAAVSPQMHRDHLATGDGKMLPVRGWLPAGKMEAIIIALHGFNDYSNAFANAGEYFSKRGIAVFAYDQRGFGRSPENGIWAGQPNLTQDLRQAIGAIHARYPAVPLYVLGESMGGAVVIATLAQEAPPGVKGAILSAPAVWGSDAMNALYRSTLWLLAHTIPGAEVAGDNIHILASDNIEMLRAMGRDPLVIKRTRIDAIYGIVGLMDYAYSHIGDVDTPLLMLYGARDQVIPKQSVERMTHQFKKPYRMAYYPEGYHMLLRDLKGDIVLGDIVSWVKYSERPLPSSYDQDWKLRMLEDPKTLPSGIVPTR